ERQSLKDDLPPIAVTSPSGQEESIALRKTEPGVARASVNAAEAGLYRLTDGTLSVLANVGPENPREFQEVVSTTEKLKSIAESTGGTIRRIGNESSSDVILPRLAAIGESPVYGGTGYAAIKRTGVSAVKGVSVLPVAAGFLGLAALLGSIILAWIFEARPWTPAARARR
ncbi:MAG TPA: hypothetical protein VFF88_06595, partial [Methylocella sp.]|nr:hypothetical protein [Methylocella sp.]